MSLSKTYPNFDNRPKWQDGLTLIEIMVVVVILSIFASIITMSVGSSDARKNRAFYEHFIDGLSYIRLLSAEGMQPMGIRFVTDNQGQIILQVVRLDNAYRSYQQSKNSSQNANKNAMELSVNISDSANESIGDTEKKPVIWVIEDRVTLPKLPDEVDIDIQSLEQSKEANRQLQPWFVGQDVPTVIWYGTGQATSVNIEIKHKGRLVGDIIQLKPDGSVQVKQ